MVESKGSASVAPREPDLFGINLDLWRKAVEENHNPRVFGPKWWVFLHGCCLEYTSSPTVLPNATEREVMNSFLLQLLRRIPCFSCRLHALDYAEKNPPDVTSSTTLFAWSVTFHNIVNKRLGKPTQTLEQVLTWMASSSKPEGGAYSSQLHPCCSAIMINQVFALAMIVAMTIAMILLVHHLRGHNNTNANFIPANRPPHTLSSSNNHHPQTASHRLNQEDRARQQQRQHSAYPPPIDWGAVY